MEPNGTHINGNKCCVLGIPRMHISQAALSQMESGEKKLRKASLEKLACALGVTVEQLRG